MYSISSLLDGRLDYWVALRVIDGAAFVTKLFGFEVCMQCQVVTIAGNNGIEMVDGCTGFHIGLFLIYLVLSWSQSVTTVFFHTSHFIILLVNVLLIANLMFMQFWGASFLTSHIIIRPLRFFTWSYSCYGCSGCVAEGFDGSTQQITFTTLIMSPKLTIPKQRSIP